MEKNNEQSIAAHVMEKIKAEHLQMKPRWHFILRTALVIIGSILLFATLLYLASFILFVLHQNGAWFVPVFGPRGWSAFLFSLPWLLIVLAILFMIVLELLVRHFAFAYRQPLLTTLLGILSLVLLGGYIVSQTSFQRRLSAMADRDRLPFAGRMYRGFGHPEFRDIHRGTIVEFMPSGFVLQNFIGEAITIVITPRTRLPFGMDFSQGDEVVVFGDRDDHHVEAFGVSKVHY